MKNFVKTFLSDDCTIGQKWDDHRFLGSTMCILHQRSEKRETFTELYYAELLGRFDAELQKKHTRLAKKKN